MNNFIDPYDFTQRLCRDDPKKWSSLYPDLEEGLGIDLCVKDLIEDGKLRMVVKLNSGNEYWAVKGHFFDGEQVRGKDPFSLPSGFYLSDSDDAGDVSYHSRLFDNQGEPITLVLTHRLPVYEECTVDRSPKPFETYMDRREKNLVGHRRVVRELHQHSVERGWRRLNHADLAPLLTGKAAKDEADKMVFEAAELVSVIKTGRLGTLYLKGVRRYKSEMTWEGQKECKAWLESIGEVRGKQLSKVEVEQLVKSLVDVFSERRKS